MPPSQILLFDQPRSAAQLLRRILSKQSNLQILGNTFGPAQVEWLMGETWAEGMSNDARSAFDTAIEKGVSTWRLALQDCRDKRNPDPGRPPLRPGTVPVLAIRDPRLAVPSAYRVLGALGLPRGSGRPNFLISTSTLWVRGAYEAYRARGGGIEPVVVDADDLMTQSPEFARRLCARLGLDPARACLAWDAPTAEERGGMHPAYYASQRFLVESSGVDASRAGTNRDLEAEMRGWEAEFGEDVGMVREMVDLAMPHYRYFYERRFTV
ncbi:uncharacterized protein PG986_002169 [Apiospora aurea]|uniref:Sulfotransferase n=1 Tax=Apiospora aurea TaxID=335848 RepID=A0ABR1QZL3_9PEZI